MFVTLTYTPTSDMRLFIKATIPNPEFSFRHFCNRNLYRSSKICNGYFEPGKTTKFRGNIGIVVFILKKGSDKNSLPQLYQN